MNGSDRALVSLLLLPPIAALFAFLLGGLTGWFVGPLLLVVGLVFAGLILWFGTAPEEERGRGPRWPWPLLAFVALYFALKFDLSHYHLLGVNGTASHALGIGLGQGTADPATNQVLGMAPVVPEGQVVLATAAQALGGTLGARLLFAWVFVGLALVGWRLVLHVLPGRPRLALVVGALCALNPGFMECVSLDSLGNALPALLLGLTLLMALAGSRPRDLGLAAGFAILVRPTLALGLLLMFCILALRPRAGSKLRWGLALGLVPPLALLVLWRFGAGLPLLFDPGLTPLGPAAMEASDSSWWWSLGSRAPWSDGPMWSVALTGALGRLGSVAALLLLVGSLRINRDRSLVVLLTSALLIPLLFVLFRGPAFSGEQADRLLIFVVPGALALASGLDGFLGALERGGRRGRIGWILALCFGSTLLLVPGNRLRELPFPVEAAAHKSFPHLLPQAPGVALPEPSGPLWWLPGYTPRHLLDPLVDQAGQRWRDLAWNVVNPRLRQRPMSMDERALSRTKGSAFSERWLPNHPLAERSIVPGSGTDPYGESTALLLEFDLSAALTEGRVEVRRGDPDLSPDDEGWLTQNPALDLAGQAGPFRLEAVRLGPGQQAVDLTLWKEYRSTRDAETAVIVMPRWAPPGGEEARALTGGTVRVRVPSKGFISIVVVLGERADTTALIAGLEWNVGLRADGRLEVFGPFRM
ncbi:MAG: hypothetical protein VX498_00315 [Myxococcota bacterium]|nr:hypothetical protein [Myxococcota bacterium]